MKKIFYSILLFLCFGCSDLKQAYVDIEDLQDRVSVIESSLSALQNAYNDGKIIKDVLPYKDVEYTGWTIIFSDNETITILDGLDGADGKDGKDGADGKDGIDGIDGKDGADGKDGVDGVTPIVAINPDGYWIVSYDNGENFSLIEDAEGKPIMSKGEKGNEGLSIRINIDENGFYIIESFYASNPDVVVDVVSTQFTSDPSKQISSIIKDPYTGIIKLIMNDGSQYDFNLDVTFPQV